MLNLTATNASLELVTSSSAGIDWDVSFIESDTTVGSSTTPVQKDGQDKTSSATTVTLVAAPGSNLTRNLKEGTWRNTHASTSNDVTIQKNVGGTLYTKFKCTLLAGEVLTYREGIWFHFDVNGGVYSVGQTFAVQADMETGTSLVLVTPPGMIKFHPSSLKAWVSCGVAADIQQSFGVSSLTDNGTGDVTVNFSTSFAAATYCANVSVEMATTTYNMSGMRNPHIRSGGRATGSCRFDCTDQTSSIAVIKDPTTWHINFKGDFA